MSRERIVEDLAEACASGDGVEVAYLDGQILPVEVDEDCGRAAFRALARFLAKESEERFADARHLAAYRNDCTCGEVPTDDIWSGIQPVLLRLATAPGRDGRRHVHVCLEAACGWGDRTLLMSWEDGETLVRVSDNDGLAVHPGSDGQETLRDIIYLSDSGRHDSTRSGR